MTSITFNGITKPYLVKLKGDGRPFFTPSTWEVLTIPNRPGGYPTRKNTSFLRFPVPVGITGITDENIQSRKKELAEWLITDEVKPLVFGDEPNLTYFAMFENTVDDFERIADIGEGVLTVFCPDPYKHGPELTDTFVNDALTINNPGTAKSKPIFEATVLQDITFAQIANSKGDYMMVGKATSVDKSPVAPYQSVLSEDCSSTVGWGVGSNLDTGDIVGSMAVNNGRFVVTDYGSGTGWHGPALKQSLPSPIQDFNIQVWIEFKPQNAYEMGRIELHGMDIDNNIICLLSLFDTFPNIKDAVGRMRIGNVSTGRNVFSERLPEWKSFYGRLALQRKGTVISASIYLYDAETGIYEHGYDETIYDYNSEYQAPLSQVQVHIGAYGAYAPVSVMNIDQIRVLEFNDLTENQIPIIARAGDKLLFDHQNDIVYLNGMDIKKEKSDFIASYFPIYPGSNQLFTFPEGTLDTTVKWRPAYK
ncbi:phage tail family protein [Radiobacillus kanasensis]|uniref:distal tail protein Dit n=1 Tax=Radiobacillus kanasensis TaxID=2844358 RepID=UPI001E334BF0|nr:distal tail protein Dit [Radiobacillus kanasensis]UFT98084.1 phage tail family protein [Radiobacillus kanasensis]